MMRLLKRRKKERERLQHNIRWIGYPHLLMIFLSSIRSKDRGRRLGHVLTMKLMQLKIIDIQLLHFLSYHFTCTVSLISHTSLGSSKIHSCYCKYTNILQDDASTRACNLHPLQQNDHLPHTDGLTLNICHTPIILHCHV